MSSSKSPVLSVAVKTYPDTCQNSVENSDNGTESESASAVVFVLTRDAHMMLMDSSSGNMISTAPIYPTENSIAISMHLLGKYASISLQFYVGFGIYHRYVHFSHVCFHIFNSGPFWQD